MNDYFGGQTRQELEALLRRLISQGAEGPKVDFKAALALADKTSQAELAKDISSIANTDDDTRLDDFGYVILGAERGRLIGGVDALSDSDKLQAQVTDIIKNFVGPVPQFSISAFEDTTLGWWGAIVIPPSNRQPHILIRDGAGDTTKHQWWVRVNDTKERAGTHDYARFLTKATQLQVRPLERELQRLSLKIEQMTAPGLAPLLEALRPQGQSNEESSAELGSQSLTTSIRSFLIKGEMAVEEALVTEALRVSEVMTETSDRNPWLLSELKPDGLNLLLAYLEEQAFPLAEAFATIARYDVDARLVDPVCRAIRIIAKEPRPVGHHYRHIAQFRLYPLALCLYAIVIVGVNEKRGELLKRTIAISLEREGSDATNPIVFALRRMPVCMLMGPATGWICSLKGPPDLQGDGTTP